MALKHRTCIAALAAQRQIAMAEQVKQRHSSQNLGGSQRSLSQNSDPNKALDADDLKYQANAAQMIRKLRELAPEDGLNQEGTDEDNNREYSGLQDEIYRVAHTLEHQTSRLNNHLPSNFNENDIHLDEYQPMSFELEKHKGQRMVKINLLNTHGFSACQEDNHKQEKPEVKPAPIHRLENALFDLSSYRQHIKSSPAPQNPQVAEKKSGQTNLDFSKASAKFILQSISVFDDAPEIDESAKSLALSLLNNC